MPHLVHIHFISPSNAFFSHLSPCRSVGTRETPIIDNWARFPFPWLIWIHSFTSVASLHSVHVPVFAPVPLVVSTSSSPSPSSSWWSSPPFPLRLFFTPRTGNPHCVVFSHLVRLCRRPIHISSYSSQRGPQDVTNPNTYVTLGTAIVSITRRKPTLGQHQRPPTHDALRVSPSQSRESFTPEARTTPRQREAERTAWLNEAQDQRGSLPYPSRRPTSRSNPRAPWPWPRKSTWRPRPPGTPRTWACVWAPTCSARPAPAPWSRPSCPSLIAPSWKTPRAAAASANVSAPASTNLSSVPTTSSSASPSPSYSPSTAAPT
ncbi:hypothetical protein CGRA01v4_08200 [Colletotrichum graminicola]|nr:hypothetical protein CGRA01v4_08200 [Colletotrichum graminicola]